MARHVSRGQARSFAVGIGGFAVLGVIVYIALTANQGRLPATPTTTVRAAFTNIGQLQAGSDVRENGIFIGRVSQTDVRGDSALVTMVLNGDVPIYSDARAEIWDQSALAQKFVELRPGTSTSGLLGDNILPVSHTDSSHDLVGLLDVFDQPTRTALGSSLRALGAGAAGYGPGLHEFIAGAPAMLTSTGQIAMTLSSPKTDLPAFLRSGDRLTSRFEGHYAEITSLLAQTDQTMQALGVDTGQPLDETLKQLPTTLRDMHGAFDSIQAPLEDTRTSVTDLRQGARALGDSTPDLRAVLREGVKPLNTVPGVADSAEPAVDELTSVFTDARPFVPRLADGLGSAAKPLAVLAPYSRDIGTFFFDIGSGLTNHNGWRHRIRIWLAPPSENSVAGQVVRDGVNAYPAPGQALRDRDANGALIPGTGR